MKIVENAMGNTVDFDFAIELMDDEIREALHAELAPCTEQEFFSAYEKLHAEKYGEQFEI